MIARLFLFLLGYATMVGLPLAGLGFLFRRRLGDAWERRLSEVLVRYKQIEKWDGRMPQYSGGGTPLINLGAK